MQHYCFGQEYIQIVRADSLAVGIIHGVQSPSKESYGRSICTWYLCLLSVLVIYMYECNKQVSF